MGNLEKILKALANKRRLQLVTYLKGSKEATVGELSSLIKLSFKSTSKHLSILFAADILEREQRGLEVFYRIKRPMSVMIHTLVSIL